MNFAQKMKQKLTTTDFKYGGKNILYEISIENKTKTYDG